MNAEIVMENEIIRGPLTVRITFLGNTAVGKTSIINRLINNTFTAQYEPTMNVENYGLNLNISENNVTKKTYVMTNLEDTFAINNPLLQTPEEFIQTEKLKNTRKDMAEKLKKIIMTANEKRKMLTEKMDNKKKDTNENKDDKQKNLLMDFFDHEKQIKTDEEQKKIFIERLGFVFVIDPLEEKSYETVKEIFDRMQVLEKRSNLCYSKCFFINKIDLIKSDESRETVKKIIKDIKEMKVRYSLESSDYYLMSALNGRGVVDSLKKFIAKIHQKQSEERQKEGIGENNIEDANDNDDIAKQIGFSDKAKLYSRKVFCGNNIFACITPVDDEEDNY